MIRYAHLRVWHAIKRRALDLNPPAPVVLNMRRVMLEIAAMDLPYSFDGGHAAKPGPSKGRSGIGFDCSGVIRYLLWRVGLLPSGENINTETMSSVLARGEGEYITFWKRDDPDPGGVHHAVVQVKHLGTPEWFEAGHTGMIVGFLRGRFITTGYSPFRRR